MLLTERRTQPRDLLAAEVCATTWDFHDKLIMGNEMDEMKIIIYNEMDHI
jgi:hypothetical protein